MENGIHLNREQLEAMPGIKATQDNGQEDQATEDTETLSDRRSLDPAQIFVHGDGRRGQQDRRQNSVPIAHDRRSTVDRRSSLDRRLRPDRRKHVQGTKQSRPRR